MKKSQFPFSGLLAAMVAGLALTACAHGTVSRDTVSVSATTDSLIRTPIEDSQFEQLLPGASVFFVYGGVGMGVPTAQVSKLDANVSFDRHIHSQDYHAVVIAGNYQHWEDGDLDQGPVMTSGSTYFQRGNVPHYDSCLGPETCVLYVYFPVSADFEFVPAN
ncbi:MAG TPA: hypothetical protein EYG02_09360 [Henriciella marina]|nr:hypothetical protein [Henriciella marina]